jgi:hypothetical protein
MTHTSLGHSRCHSHAQETAPDEVRQGLKQEGLRQTTGQHRGITLEAPADIIPESACAGRTPVFRQSGSGGRLQLRCRAKDVSQTCNGRIRRGWKCSHFLLLC